MPSDIEPDFSVPRGQLRLELATWGLAFHGAVLAAPEAPFHTEAARSGQCRLLTYTWVDCTPECPFPSRCVSGACRAPPALLSAGTLTLGGFPGAPIAIPEADPGVYFFQSEALTAADAGPRLTLAAQGSPDVPAFALEVGPVAAPVPAGDWSAALEARAAGADVTLTWSDVDQDSRIYLRMTTGVGTHGGISPVEIECESPDTGRLVLPGAYLDQLYDDGGWSCGECGDNNVWRYRAATTASDIQFRAEARTTFFFRP